MIMYQSLTHIKRHTGSYLRKTFNTDPALCGLGSDGYHKPALGVAMLSPLYLGLGNVELEGRFFHIRVPGDQCFPHLSIWISMGGPSGM
jgi:hypothetical protein